MIFLQTTFSTYMFSFLLDLKLKIVSEYDQELPPSQTVDKPMALQGRATQHS